MFQTGDRIAIAEGHEHAGREGVFLYWGTTSFTTGRGRVKLDRLRKNGSTTSLFVDAKFITMAKAVRKTKAERSGIVFGKDTRVKVLSGGYIGKTGVIQSHELEEGCYRVVLDWPDPRLPGTPLLDPMLLDLTEEVQPPFGIGDMVLINFSGYEGTVGAIQELTGHNAKVLLRDGTTEPFSISWLEPAPAFSEPEFRNVLISEIRPDPNQPRRHFDQAKMEDMMNSVREKGILQPVVLRPHPDGNGFMLVVGERRFRASLSVNAAFKDRNTIPAIIRLLSDDEALDLQITENLQREDVHPMEEAIAIKSRLDHGKTLDDICALQGKSKQYIASRLKLNDLIAEFQEAYLNGLMEHSDARLICATTPEQQIALFREQARYLAPTPPEDVKDSAVSAQLDEDDDEDEDEGDIYSDADDDYDDDEEELQDDEPLRTEGLKKFSFYNLKSWANQQHHKLDSASFKTEDAELYPEMGACGDCPHNSSNTMLLFMEEGGRICSNGVCFGIKTQRAYQKQLQEMAADPEMLFVAGYSYSDESKSKIAAAKELGLIVLKDSEWRTSHSNDKQDKVRKAFMVAGYDAGKVINVIVNTSSSAAAKAAAEGGSSAKVQIAEIQGREARAKELDREKIYAAVQPLLEKNEVFLSSTAPLSREETVALAILLSHNWGYEIDKEFKKMFEHSNDAELHKVLLEQLLPGTMNLFIRKAIMHGLRGQASDYARHGNSAAVMALARQYLPSEVKEIELLQEEKAIKRQARVTQRIEDLKASEKKDKKTKKAETAPVSE